MKPTIVAATKSFEKWLATRIPVVKTDLARKHEAMASDPFIFLRATFYRWAQVFPDRPPRFTQPIFLTRRNRHRCDDATLRSLEETGGRDSPSRVSPVRLSKTPTTCFNKHTICSIRQNKEN
jgi:hypothetical protein